MSGHSKWHQIRRKKEIIDQKRGKLFTKLLKEVTVAARDEAKPEFNPRLKAAVERARQFNVPQENIERAIQKTSETGNLEEIAVEAYGPGGAALIIEAISDNRNRTIQEIKAVLKEHGGRIAEPGATAWAFEKSGEGWRPKFKRGLESEDREEARNLVLALEGHDDVQKVYTNT
ncbi:MAG: YebC/PmpR family DNA-binding transcriptional regulator [Candidatus Brennerbacteria bacterium]|nr:YebC/PmpR family DNA-binding transcriptional regulator [Candidatus Brennerbacteria bacterium]